MAQRKRDFFSVFVFGRRRNGGIFGHLQRASFFAARAKADGRRSVFSRIETRAVLLHRPTNRAAIVDNRLLVLHAETLLEAVDTSAGVHQLL
ncbi:MAG: hypothetical protein RR320_02305, partial [Oscillospiraceae bacterium]